MPNPTWNNLLLILLCRMYEAWGGDCSELPRSAHERIESLVWLYGADGAPEFADEGAKNAFLALLDETSVLLDSPENDLSPADNTSIRELITSLRNDLNPPIG